MLRFRAKGNTLLQIGPLSMVVQYYVDSDLYSVEFSFTTKELLDFLDFLYSYANCVTTIHDIPDFITTTTRPSWFATAEDFTTIVLEGLTPTDTRSVTVDMNQMEAENLANAISQKLLFTPDEYQQKTSHTATYFEAPVPDLAYLGLGLTGEAGEVADAIKKLFRDANGIVDQIFIDQIEKEIGDVLWYCAQILSQCDLSLEQTMRTNLLKLQSRQERGVLGGNGDNR